MIARRLNRFLKLKTQSNGHFCGSIPSQKVNYNEILAKILEQLAIFRGIFELQEPVENFLGVITPRCGYVKSSLGVDLHAEEKIKVI